MFVAVSAGQVSHKQKAAIKHHTIMDLEGSIPTFIHISDGKTHDVNVLDMIPILAGSIYIMDRGYLDFKRLYNLHTQGGRFVIRARKNLQFYRKSSTPVDSSTGLQCDQIIGLTGDQTKYYYPDSLRRVRFIDQKNHQNIVLLTNMTHCDASQIADYYKSRWPRGFGVLQMDQAKPENQSILWTKHQCRQNASMDCYLHLFDHDDLPQNQSI